jgi:hypothetical protein
MADQEEIVFMTTPYTRVIMGKTEFKEKPYFYIAKHKQDKDSGKWQYGKQTILININQKTEFIEALKAWIEFMENDVTESSNG